MPMDLSPTVVAEKNKRANADSVFLYAVEITIPGTDEPARVVLNTEDITWQGNVFKAVEFSIEGLQATSTGEVPQVALKVSNVNRVFERYVQEYDAYCKLNGYTPIEFSIYELNTADLGNPNPCVEHIFTLKEPSTDANWATFIISASNPALRRAPFNLVKKDWCTHFFKGPRCGYSGTATTCNKHLITCRSLGNSTRFGGAPGAGKSGLTLAAA